MFTRESIPVACEMPLPANLPSKQFQMGRLKSMPEGSYRISKHGALERDGVLTRISGKVKLTQCWPVDEEMGMAAGYREIVFAARLVDGLVVEISLKSDRIRCG